MMRKVTNNLPQMQSAPYVIVTNGADRFTLYSNFLPIDRCGEGDGAGDVEVVGESAAVYLFGQAVVAGHEVEQADMAIDGGGAVGGYGAQDGGEAEVLGEWNLLPVAVSLALDGVLLSVALVTASVLSVVCSASTIACRAVGRHEANARANIIVTIAFLFIIVSFLLYLLKL